MPRFTTDLSKDFSFGDSKMHVFLAQHVADEAEADFLADLGDIDLDLGVPIDKCRSRVCNCDTVRVIRSAEVAAGGFKARRRGGPRSAPEQMYGVM